jgi:hypothetical protein
MMTSKEIKHIEDFARKAADAVFPNKLSIQNLHLFTCAKEHIPALILEVERLRQLLGYDQDEHA